MTNGLGSEPLPEPVLIQMCDHMVSLDHNELKPVVYIFLVCIISVYRKYNKDKYHNILGSPFSVREIKATPYMPPPCISQRKITATDIGIVLFFATYRSYAFLSTTINRNDAIWVEMHINSLAKLLVGRLWGTHEWNDKTSIFLSLCMENVQLR